MNEKVLSFKKSDNTDECIFENGKMRNGKVLEDFYHEYEDGEKAEAEVFTLKEDGTYTMTAFIYDSEKDVYEYNPVYPGTPYIPFGEVIDYQNNPDGSIDLTVDGVWPDYDSDCGFRCYMKVKPHSDGSFMYLSNQVEAVELSIPKVNRY